MSAHADGFSARRAARRRTLVASVLFVLGVANVIAVALAPSARAATADQTFAITIDNRQALFQLDALAPGPIGQRCLGLTVANGHAPTAMLSTAVGGTGLGPYLTMTVEAGKATDVTTCAGFTGTTIFTGTLADLGRDHTEPADGVALALDDGKSAVVRFTIALADDNRAQGLTATATLRFDAVDDGTILGTRVQPPASTTIRPSPSSTTEPGGDTTAVTRVTSTPSVIISDGTVEPDHGFWPSAGQIAAVAARSVELSAKASTVPAVFVVFALGFLLVQGRIDRDDPKLARAPLQPEPELLFMPRGAST